MKTSTTTRLSSEQLEDSVFISSIQARPRYDVMVSAHAQTPPMTIVQISPVRAPPEVTLAIRRQRQAAGTVYPRNPEHSKPEFKVVLSGNFHPDSTQFIVTSSHCLSRGQPSNNHYHHYSNGAVSQHHKGSRRTRSLNNGSRSFESSNTGTSGHVCSTTWSRHGGNYSDIYTKQAAGSDYGNQGKQNSRSQYENNTYNTPLDVVRKSTKPGNAVYSFSQNETVQEIWNTRTNSISGFKEIARKEEHFDNQNVPASTTADDSFHTFPKVSSLKSVSSNWHKCTSSAVQRTGSQNAGISPSLHPAYPKGMPSLQFADSILDCVGSNLDRLYQLCQTKLRYYEYLEQLYPAMFIESPTSSDQEQQTGSHCFVVSNPASDFTEPTPPSSKSLNTATTLTTPSSSKSLNTATTLTTPSSSSPMSLNLTFPNQKDFASATRSRSTCSQQAILPDHMLIKGNVKRPVSDDAPQTVVTESDNHKQPVSATRSILKTPRMDRLYSDNIANSRIRASTSPCQTLQDMSVIGGDLFTVTRVTREQIVMPGSNVQLFSKDKGRLVRFSVDNKIHEFTPLEPVSTNCQH